AFRCVLIALVSGIAACDRNPGEPAEVSDDAAPAALPSSSKPRSRGAAGERGYVGVVAPRRTAAVAAAISAPGQEVYVHMGDAVKKGDPILSVDTRTIQDDLAAANAAAAASRAGSEQARLEVENSRREHNLEKGLNAQGVSPDEKVRATEITVR